MSGRHRHDARGKQKKSTLRQKTLFLLSLALGIVYFSLMFRAIHLASSTTLSHRKSKEQSWYYFLEHSLSSKGDAAAAAAQRTNKREEEIDTNFRFPHPDNLKLPLPIINVGFPKAGTSTIFKFFHCNGMLGQHWYCCERQNNSAETQHKILMSRCILENVVAGRLLFEGCGEYEFYSEINGPRKFRDFNGKNLLDDGTLENRDTPRMLLPQHHYMDKIHEQFPNATFILNLRPVDAWVNSVLNWPTSLKREIPGEFFGQQKERDFSKLPRSKKQLRASLKHIYDFHSQYVRDFVRKHPSHALIEVDITNEEAGIQLADAFGLHETCWGHANKNDVPKAFTFFTEFDEDYSSVNNDDRPADFYRHRKKTRDTGGIVNEGEKKANPALEGLLEKRNEALAARRQGKVVGRKTVNVTDELERIRHDREERLGKGSNLQLGSSSGANVKVPKRGW